MFSEATVRATVEQLQERIRQLQAAPRRYLSVLCTGLPPLDGLLPAGGFVLGQAVELWGEPASGRTTLALLAMAAAHREARLCAFVDGPRELYPPAAVALGVDLKRLLWARPAPKQLVWTAVQLLRSGAFTGVALDLTGTGRRLSLPEAKKLTDAAAQGGAALWVLTPREAPGEGMTRFHLQAEPEGLHLEVVRGRQGGQGARAFLPWEILSPAHPGPALPLPSWGVPRGSGAAAVRPARAVDARNGPPGIIGQRPGRDTAMPPLRPLLGCSVLRTPPVGRQSPPPPVGIAGE